MKNTSILILTVLVWACSSPEKTAEQDHKGHEGHTPAATEASKPKSPKQMAMANIGNTHVHIEYSSPGKRGRTIFGGLVAYDEVWVTGAHRATAINFPNAVKIGEVAIEPGKYAIFTIPGKEKWIIIINKKWDQHLADEYDAADDVVRVDATPVLLNEAVESLTYAVEETGELKGKISISWDDVMVSFEIETL